MNSVKRQLPPEGSRALFRLVGVAKGKARLRLLRARALPRDSSNSRRQEGGTKPCGVYQLIELCSRPCAGARHGNIRR